MQSEQDIPASCRLRVYVHGPLEVWQRTPEDAWEPVEKEAWGKGRPARSVFKRLLAAPGRRLSRGKLQEDIWPDSEDGELAEKSLYNAINQIRQVVGKPLLKTIETIYEIADQGQIWVDSDAAEALLKEAENRGHTSIQALPLLEQALSYLERGELFEGESGTWVYGVRKKSEDLLRQCRLWLAEAYERDDKLLQAGLQYRALLQTMPPDENALRCWMNMLARHNKLEEALKHYRNTKKNCEAQGYTFSTKTEQLARRMNDELIMESKAHGTSTALSQRSILDLGASTVADMTGDLRSLWVDDLLAIYARGIAVCQDLYFSGSPHQVEATLPLYYDQTALLARQPSPLQQTAARLASQALQLACELFTDREDFGAAEQAGRRAFLYGQLAGDSNLQVAALIGLANLGFHRKLSTAALHAYEYAVSLLSEYVTPLLKGRTYAGLAEVYAMRGQFQEAMRAMGLAYEYYPLKPEEDPAYPYLRASRYSLYVFGDAQSHLFLGHPKEADKALLAMQRETNDPLIEPITKLDLLYYQAETQIQQAELEASGTVLTEAAQLSKELGSRLYFNKLAASYHSLRAQWPEEPQVVALEDVFRPW